MSLNVDQENVTAAVLEAVGQIDAAGGEVVLDFSSVRRIDSRALGALEQLAGAAEAKAAKVKLCGVNIEIYKALKLAKVAGKFVFPA